MSEAAKSNIAAPGYGEWRALDSRGKAALLSGMIDASQLQFSEGYSKGLLDAEVYLYRKKGSSAAKEIRGIHLLDTYGPMYSRSIAAYVSNVDEVYARRPAARRIALSVIVACLADGHRKPCPSEHT